MVMTWQAKDRLGGSGRPGQYQGIGGDSYSGMGGGSYDPCTSHALFCSTILVLVSQCY